MTKINPEADHELGSLFPQTEEEMIQFHITDPELKEPSEAEIEANTSAILKRLGHKVAITVACAYCKGGLEPGKSCYCAVCLAPHHEDCFRDYGRCSSCKEVEFVRPKKSEPMELVPRSRTRRNSGFLLGMMAGSISVAAAVSLTFHLWPNTPENPVPQPMLTKRQKSQLILLQAREKQRNGAKEKVILSLVNSALDGSERDSEVLVEASQIYLSASLFNQAKPLLEEAVKKNPESYAALFHLHSIESRVDLDSSLTMTKWLQQLLETAKKTGDKNQYTLFAEAVENQRKGNWQTALGLYHQTQLKDLVVVSNTASCYKQLGQYNLAIDTLSSAIELKWQPQLLVDRGMLCFNVGDYDRALQDFTTVIEKNPKDGKTLTLRGEVLVKTGRTKEALTEFNRILTLDPNNVNALEKRAAIYLKMRSVNEALEDYTTALRINPALSNIYLQRGKIFLSNKQFTAAIQDFTRAIELNSALSKAYLYRGKVYLELKRFGEANADFAITLKLDPADRNCRFSQAQSLFQLGQREQALTNLRKLAIGEDPYAKRARKLLNEKRPRWQESKKKK